MFIRGRKLNISLVFITQSYFSVQEDVRLNSTHYFIMKLSNERELQNIAINHSADTDHQDFMNIYRECTDESFNFLAVDSTLLASDPLSLRKNCLVLIKMTVTDQTKILDRNIMQNETQYDLDKKAKISALSSNNWDKYAYLTGEDWGLQLSTVEQAKFEYSPLDKIFYKGLNEDDKEDRLFKRLKIIQGKIKGENNKNQNQLKMKNS